MSKTQQTACWLLILAGILVRLPHLADPPLGFHPIRQYRSAIIARGLYLPYMTGLSRDERQAADTAAAQQSAIEPLIMEHVASWAYRMAGREELALPRLVSVGAWAYGAVALALLAGYFFSGAAVIAAVALMMFLPFGIPASQAFQPDPLMTVLTVVAIAAAVRHDARRGYGALILLTAATGAALFVKPMAVFFVVPVVFALAIRRLGLVRAVLFVTAWTAVASLPTAIYYYDLSRTSPSTFGARFFPQLLVVPAYWRGWVVMLHRVAWLPCVAGGLVGVALVKGTPRIVLAALWAGYVGFGLLFTHHIHTHDYYSLPVIPIVALSVAALVEAIARRVPAGVARSVAGGVGVAALVAGILLSVRAAEVFGSTSDANRLVAMYERIGRVVGHSTRVLSLDPNYAAPLNYHGFVCAANRPLSIDFAVTRMAGVPDAPAEARLGASGGDFFVATDQAELGAQPDLQGILDQRFPVIERDGRTDRWRFVVYDLRRSRVSTKPEAVSLFAVTSGERFSRESVSLWSTPTTHWRIVVPAPELFEVQPAAGSGPATLRLVPRAVPSAIDRIVQVPIYSDASTAPSAVLTVRFRALTSAGSAPPFGWVDLPQDPVVLGKDPVTFQGWALDDFEVRRVWAGYVEASGNPVSLGEASRAGARPDVGAAYPGAHDAFNAAWVFTLRPEALPALPRPIVVHFFAEDADGRRAEIGARTIRTAR